ncbi:MAG: pyruvate dehydrogenase E2 component (dihydrolipoamide acetyltransferase) [Flavobacteriales bacterium]|jgi:pyruvate dehydrogenase E2 component (dihydrolipoamide acetyltransferase)
MAEIIKMPKLSDTMTDGVVAEWHKNIGDQVESGELLAEIETDKATMEFESYSDGTLLHIGVEKGGSAPVNSVLCVIGEKDEDFQALLDAQSTSEKAATPEVASPAPVATPNPAPVQEAAAPVAIAPSPDPVSSNGRVKASPLAKKLAQDKGINIETIQGSGEGGRIVKRDVESYTAAPAAIAAVPSVAGEESFTEEPVSQMRKVIARRLAESKFTAPHFYLTIQVDMDGAIAARKSLFEQAGIKISFNDLVIKAAAAALKKHPKVNSSWLEDKIRYNNHVHIGVAVAVEDGLLVPVVRHADLKPLTAINAEVKALAEKAKTKKLQPAEWEGNTFTISNLGMFGIEEFTAIINPPDSCILAVGGIIETPVVKNGQVVPGNIMKLTLSCDHRVVDGVTGSQFLQALKMNLENPVMMLA